MTQSCFLQGKRFIAELNRVAEHTSSSVFTVQQLRDVGKVREKPHALMTLYSYTNVQIQLAITSVWKVQFQEFDHFSVVCNELFHIVHLTQKCFSTQICPFS